MLDKFVLKTLHGRKQFENEGIEDLKLIKIHFLSILISQYSILSLK
jgi:hypothetical protein